MPLFFLRAKLSILPPLFRAGYDAIFSGLPLWQRWRLLLLQNLNVLAALITAPAWLFSNRYSVLYVPTRSGKKRCLVWQPPQRKEKGEGEARGELRPLHIDIHGGGFIGGLPELDARWCGYLSDRTGAVVVSCSYRIAPRFAFPAAHDDIDDIVSWLISHASSLNADPNLLTVGGSSVGGNLALSTAQYLHQQAQCSQSSYTPRAFIAFCPPVNFRLKPEEKPRPPSFPTKDPFSFLVPMYDTYAGPNRARDWDNPRLNPIVAAKESLPKDMLFIVAGIDILMHEQLTMVERIRREIDAEGDEGRKVEAKVFDKGFHGWLELPKWILEEERMAAFNASVDFIMSVHRKNGFDVDKLL